MRRRRRTTSSSTARSSPSGSPPSRRAPSRDAGNGGAFIAELRERFALDARILDGEEEARLTYLGASGRAAAGRDAADRTLVIDIGGGSTELVVGSGSEIGFHTSLQAGTVRHSERHLPHDPPTPAELETLADDVRSLIDAELGAEAMVSAKDGIAVAGTPTSLAAIDLELDPYDPDAVEGHRLSLEIDPAHVLARSRRYRSRSGSRSPACTPTGRRRSSPGS